MFKEKGCLSTLVDDRATWGMREKQWCPSGGFSPMTLVHASILRFIGVSHTPYYELCLVLDSELK